jgi:hypothetical protein
MNATMSRTHDARDHVMRQAIGGGEHAARQPLREANRVNEDKRHDKAERAS